MQRFLIAVLVIALPACVHSNRSSGEEEAEPPFAVSVRQGVLFSPDDWPRELRADIHRPNVNTRLPAVLMVHGGGWERRSRSDMSRIANRVAREGFVVVNIDHRFAPDFRFPAQLHDVQLAMHWIHDNADDLGIDARRIGAFGFSSGAHLLSLMAVTAGQNTELDSPHGGSRTRPDAVVAGGVPSDLTKFESGRRLVQLIGDTETAMKETYQQASPVTHVHSGAPPFFFFHGTMDRLVPIDHAEDFQQKLEATGIETVFHRQRLRGHLLSFIFSGSATDSATEFLQQTLTESGG